MNWIQAIIIAIVEGLTEYLPISSTAHMVFTSHLLGVDEGDNFVKMFELCIQFGAILAVVALYWKKFFDFKRLNFYVKLGFAVIPALVLGKLLDEKIEAVLDKPIYMTVMLVIGGVVFLFIDKFFQNPTTLKEEDVSIKQAVIIGFWQCLAMMPGTSRSAASIIGGMQQKLSREAAAEFSFFLAVPTMLAVTVYSLVLKDWTVDGIDIKGYEFLSQNTNLLSLFIVGQIIAFVVAVVAIKSFVSLIKKYGFKPWGWYRIVIGTILFIYFYYTQK